MKVRVRVGVGVRVRVRTARAAGAPMTRIHADARSLSSSSDILLTAARASLSDIPGDSDGEWRCRFFLARRRKK